MSKLMFKSVYKSKNFNLTFQHLLQSKILYGYYLSFVNHFEQEYYIQTLNQPLVHQILELKLKSAIQTDGKRTKDARFEVKKLAGAQAHDRRNLPEAPKPPNRQRLHSGSRRQLRQGAGQPERGDLRGRPGVVRAVRRRVRADHTRVPRRGARPEARERFRFGENHRGGEVPDQVDQDQGGEERGRVRSAAVHRQGGAAGVGGADEGSFRGAGRRLEGLF